MLFGYGKFSLEDVTRTYKVLVCFSLAIMCSAWQPMLLRCFYVFKKNMLLLKVEIVTFILNALLDWIFMYYWGMYGIAIATSLVVTINTFYLFYLLKRELGINVINKDMIVFFLKIFVSALVMIVLGMAMAYFIKRHISSDILLYKLCCLGIFITISIVIYLLFIFLLTKKEMSMLWKKFRQ